MAVKSAKRLLRDHCSPSGRLDTDAYMMAIMAHRNTPDPFLGLSPGQIVYGRPLQDTFRFMSDNKFSDQRVRGIWWEAWANRHHFYSQREATNVHARELGLLDVGAKVFVQNQHGNHPLFWDKTGTVIEILPNSAFQVKYDGSGRLAKKTQRHLRKFERLDVQNLQSTMPMQTSGPAAPQECRGGPIATPRVEEATLQDTSATKPPQESEVQQTQTPAHELDARTPNKALDQPHRRRGSSSALPECAGHAKLTNTKSTTRTCCQRDTQLLHGIQAGRDVLRTDIRLENSITRRDGEYGH